MITFKDTCYKITFKVPNGPLWTEIFYSSKWIKAYPFITSPAEYILHVFGNDLTIISIEVIE